MLVLNYCLKIKNNTHIFCEYFLIYYTRKYMKIIFSPSKSQNSKPIVKKSLQSSSLFLQKHDQLREIILALRLEDFSRIFKLSDGKSKQLRDLYHSDLPLQSAIDLFKGTSFKELKLIDYNQDQNDYLQNTLCILSAYYGILHPFDYIHQYRLDMNDKVLPEKYEFKNLYEFWQKEIDKYFKNADLILNLASDEYSKMLKNFDKNKIISIKFLAQKNGKLKSISVISKQERGKLLDYCIKHTLKDPLVLKKYTSNGFVYSKELSTKTNFCFVKK